MALVILCEAQLSVGNTPDRIVGENTNDFDGNPINFIKMSKSTVYSSSTYFKGLTHEYIHSFHNYFYNDPTFDINPPREGFIWMNFHRLRTNSVYR